MSFAMPPQQLVLRDIHQSQAPPWWPPAPGWWLLFAVLVALVAIASWWWLRRRRRSAEITRAFDERVHAEVTPVAQVAAISELLRRAARRRDPAAARIDGEAWLRFLDGHREPEAVAGKNVQPSFPRTRESSDFEFDGTTPMDSRVRGNDRQERAAAGNTSKRTPFSQGPGRVLLDGVYRRTIAQDDVAALLPLARKRYQELMAVRPSTGSG